MIDELIKTIRAEMRCGDNIDFDDIRALIAHIEYLQGRLDYCERRRQVD
jgi:hypothetical protein